MNNKYFGCVICGVRATSRGFISIPSEFGNFWIQIDLKSLIILIFISGKLLKIETHRFQRNYNGKAVVMTGKHIPISIAWRLRHDFTHNDHLWVVRKKFCSSSIVDG